MMMASGSPMVVQDGCWASARSLKGLRISAEKNMKQTGRYAILSSGGHRHVSGLGHRYGRGSSVALIAAVALVITATPAFAALPETVPDDTWMVSGRVRAIADAGGLTWIGGKFTSLQTPTGAAGTSVTGLTAFTDAGEPASASPPTFTGTGIEVWDMYVGPDDVLYVAGKFGYASGGKAYRNLVGLDPVTGSIVRRFRTPVVKSVYTDGVTVYGGGSKVLAYDAATGSSRAGFTPISILVDDSLRAHQTAELIRDIQAWGPWLVATGQFDFVNIDGSWDDQKVFFRFDPATGEVDPAWAPANIGQSGAA